MSGSSKFKDSADGSFRFDQSGRKFLRWVENTVGKGEIARNDKNHVCRIQSVTCLKLKTINACLPGHGFDIDAINPTRMLLREI